MGAGVRIRESIILHGASLHVSRACPWTGVVSSSAPCCTSHPPLYCRTTPVSSIPSWAGTAPLGAGPGLKGHPVTPTPTIPMPKLTARHSSVMAASRLPSQSWVSTSQPYTGSYNVGLGPLPLFKPLMLSLTGCSVTIPAEVVILNSIVLPHKELSRSYKNQIIL